METVYFSFSNFSELIREAAPLVLFGPSPYFMEGLEYKLVTITLSMVKGAENVKWEILRDETYYIYVQSFYLSKGQRYPLESLPNPALACARPLGCLSKVFFYWPPLQSWPHAKNPVWPTFGSPIILHHSRKHPRYTSSDSMLVVVVVKLSIIRYPCSSRYWKVKVKCSNRKWNLSRL